ncbi:MAG: hypothetical protein P8176_07135 [Gammaproteobacteria bacterium]
MDASRQAMGYQTKICPKSLFIYSRFLGQCLLIATLLCIATGDETRSSTGNHFVKNHHSTALLLLSNTAYESELKRIERSPDIIFNPLDNELCPALLTRTHYYFPESHYDQAHFVFHQSRAPPLA